MAGPRRRAREIALQVLHLQDGSPELDASTALARFFDHLADGRGLVEDEGERELGQEYPDSAGVGPASAMSAVALDRPLVEELVRGVEQHRAALDEALAQLSRNWRVERMAVVERNIIRLALYEFQHCPGVPVAVAINEAVELAKRFGTAEGAAFVNGLLDRAVSELQIRR
jgi:N utilization substance protein B